MLDQRNVLFARRSPKRRQWHWLTADRHETRNSEDEVDVAVFQ